MPMNSLEQHLFHKLGGLSVSVLMIRALLLLIGVYIRPLILGNSKYHAMLRPSDLRKIPTCFQWLLMKPAREREHLWKVGQACAALKVGWYVSQTLSF